MYSVIVNASNAENYTNSNFNLTHDECFKDKKLHPSYFGISLAVPEWEAILTAIILLIIILLTIIGNVLVILSVFTYKPLRIVQNFFIVSLAVADLTVAILVLPFNVAYSILGRWDFGIHLCKMWLTCDVLCCTSSILNLCAIALDRYWAITDPINYAQKRTVERVLLLIAGVWILSLIISSPPLLGWNDWPDQDSNDYPCQLTSNPGYVIYSALGSFYIPLIIMSMVYLKIFIATRKRLRARAKATKLNTMAMKNTAYNRDETNPDQESISSETIQNESIVLDECDNIKRKLRRSKHKFKDNLKNQQQQQQQHQLQLQQSKNSSSSTSSVSKKLLQTTGDGNGGAITEITTADNIKNDNTLDYATKLNFDEKLSNKSIKSSKKLLKGHVVHQFIEEKQKISLSKERKAARTLGIIMGVFVVCWLPFFLMYIILPFCPSCCPTDKFMNFITWLGYINSCINPVIYTIFNLDYRRAFKKLLGIKS